jgi:simple sugar transport system permease protein
MKADIAAPTSNRPVRPLWRLPNRQLILALCLGLAAVACLIALSGTDPLTASSAFVRGAFGSLDRISVAVNKATPYILCGTGVALCFRANIINIGGEGQIALGGLAAAWWALAFPLQNPVLAIASSLVAGIAAGALWALIAALLHLTRRINEVIVTLLMNFVAVLAVQWIVQDYIGEPGAGFPQTPMLEPAYWLPKFFSGSDLHWGAALAVVVAVLGHVCLWHTKWGYTLRLAGASPHAARYAGVSVFGTTMTVMAVAGGLAGLAGSVEVLGLQYRMIAGFSQGFGFNAVAIALLAGRQPLAVLPAGLFLGFLEAGALAMQREVGSPSSLVAMIEGLTMLFALVIAGAAGRKGRI